MLVAVDPYSLIILYVNSVVNPIKYISSKSARQRSMYFGTTLRFKQSVISLLKVTNLSLMHRYLL